MTENNYIKPFFTVLKRPYEVEFQVGTVGPYYIDKDGAGITVDSKRYFKIRRYFFGHRLKLPRIR